MLPVVTGVALGFSFPPFGLGPLAWIALVPLFIRWAHARSARRLYVEAYACFLVACVVAFHWVLLHPVHNAALASLGGLLFFPLLLSLPIAVSLPFRKRWGMIGGLLALTAMHVSMEWALHHGPFAFPWPVLAHTQSTVDPFRQMADLSGPSTLSAWVILLNAGVTLAITAWRPLVRCGTLGAVALLLVGPALYGWARADNPLRAGTHTQALLVQPGVPASEWADLESPIRLNRLLRLSNAALDTSDRVDTVIWPETALYLPADSTSRSDRVRHLRAWANQRNIALLTGAIVEVGDAPTQEGRYYNTVLLFDARGAQSYRKNYLVPFAEFVPLVDQLPGLSALRVPAGGVAGYERGQEPSTLATASFQAGALICFESLFTHHIRAYVNPALTAPSVDFLVTVAQDGWWGPSAGYRQHIAFSQLRAIASRRAMAFVTVSGQTGLIGPKGRLHAATEWMTPTVRRVEIPHVTALSPYIRFGDLVSGFALLVTAACAAIAMGWIMQRSGQ